MMNSSGKSFDILIRTTSLSVEQNSILYYFLKYLELIYLDITLNDKNFLSVTFTTVDSKYSIRIFYVNNY